MSKNLDQGHKEVPGNQSHEEPLGLASAPGVDNMVALAAVEQPGAFEPMVEVLKEDETPEKSLKTR